MYFATFNQFIELGANQKLHVEIGRALVGQCEALVSKVMYFKKVVKTNFVIPDAGMAELIGLALYRFFDKGTVNSDFLLGVDSTNILH